MPRLFVALRLPEETVDRVERLCRGLPGARWTEFDKFHLTLRFIGEVDHPTFCEIGEGLMNISLPPFELQLSDLGHFPPRGELRQLWVGIQPSEALLKLKRRIDRIVSQAGVEPERRKFIPHVTLARFAYPPAPDRLASYLARRQGFRTEAFPVSSFELLSSRLNRERAEHIVEADYDFVRGVMERV